MTVTRGWIIAEIQRIAAASGGKAPGVRKFADATGIRQHEWFGVFWAKWSDALAEAGLSANEMQGRTSDDDIALAVVGAIRDLGHYPSVGEMKLRRRADPTFPVDTVFKTRGGRSGGARIVLDFCLREPEKYADVIDVVEPIAAAGSATGEPASITEPAIRDGERIAGYVYLIKSSKFYKVGHSTDVHRRMLQLNTGMPEAGELIHTISTDDPAGIEAYWHRRFADRRLRPDAEWFDLSTEDVRAFKRRKFQ